MCMCVCVRVPHIMCIYTHNGVLLSHKKEQNNVICATWMDLEIIILSEVRERERFDITYVWILKSDTGELIYKQKYIHRHRKQTYGYQRG